MTGRSRGRSSSRPSTHLRTILEQAKPQSQWYDWRIGGTSSRTAALSAGRTHGHTDRL